MSRTIISIPVHSTSRAIQRVRSVMGLPLTGPPASQPLSHLDAGRSETCRLLPPLRTDPAPIDTLPVSPLELAPAGFGEQVPAAAALARKLPLSLVLRQIVGRAAWSAGCMAFVPIERAAEVRTALLAVVSDPEHGADALYDPRLMASLLHARLPRGTSLLVTAVDAGIPMTLRRAAAQGADVRSAMSRAASSFARQTPYLPEACIWVVNELAIALGLTTDAAALPVLETSDGEQAPTTAKGAASGRLTAASIGWLRKCTFAGQPYAPPRVQLRIQGGIAGLDTLIAVKGRRVKVTNRIGSKEDIPSRPREGS
jgi:hypothetical protein